VHTPGTTYWLLCQRNTLVTATGAPCTSRLQRVSCRSRRCGNLQLGHHPPDVVLGRVRGRGGPARSRVCRGSVARTRVLYKPGRARRPGNRPVPPRASPPTFRLPRSGERRQGDPHVWSVRSRGPDFPDRRASSSAGRGTDVHAVTRRPVSTASTTAAGWTRAGRDAFLRRDRRAGRAVRVAGPPRRSSSTRRGPRRHPGHRGAPAGGIPELVGADLGAAAVRPPVPSTS